MNEKDDKEKSVKPEELSGILRKMVSEICPGNIINEHVKIYGIKRDNMVLSVFTRNFEYEINVHPLADYDPLWMIIMARGRKVIAGENRPQEFQIYAGDFNHENWLEVKDKILQFELVKIVKQARILDDLS